MPERLVEVKIPPEQISFDYSALDPDIAGYLRIHARKIHDIARVTAQGIHLIGHHLTEARKRLKDDGLFLRWIANEFAWKKSTAYSFMQVYDNIQLPNFGNLQIDVSALYLIAAPKTPEPVRTEIVRRAETGEPVTHESVKAVMRQFEKNGDLPAATAKLATIVTQAREQRQQSDAAAERALPSPSEARRLAIASGAHTLDSNGVYQPPLTKAAQEEWRNDSDRLSRLRDFIYWHQEGQNAQELASIVTERHWLRDFNADSIQSAIQWLTEFEELLCQKTSAQKSRH